MNGASAQDNSSCRFPPQQKNIKENQKNIKTQKNMDELHLTNLDINQQHPSILTRSFLNNLNNIFVDLNKLYFN